VIGGPDGYRSSVRAEHAFGLWQEGERRLRQAEPEDRPALDRVTDAIVDELRRRLGGTFTTSELAALYEPALDWSFDIATRVAPDNPSSWDVTTVTGAAFARYVRSAADWAGGRRVELEE
jgi:hypothetical protein